MINTNPTKDTLSFIEKEKYVKPSCCFFELNTEGIICISGNKGPGDAWGGDSDEDGVTMTFREDRDIFNR